MAAKEYGKVESAFWRRGTGKRLRGDACAQLVALHLMTCPSRHMTGIFYLPLPVIAHETGLPLEGVVKGLQRLREEKFAYYDEDEELVFLPNMARVQAGDSLVPSDNRHTSVVKQLDLYREHEFVERFLGLYGDSYQLFAFPPKEGKPNPFEAPSKPLSGAGAGTRTGTGAVVGEARAPARTGGDDGGVHHDPAPGARARLASAAMREPTQHGDGRELLSLAEVSQAWADACNAPNRRSPGSGGHTTTVFGAYYAVIRDAVNGQPEPAAALVALFEWVWSHPDGPIVGKRIKPNLLDPSHVARHIDRDLERALGRDTRPEGAAKRLATPEEHEAQREDTERNLDFAGDLA